MNETAKTIPLIPNWKAAASIAIMAIEAGTPAGVEAGKETVREMAEKFDNFIAEMHEAGHIVDPGADGRI